MVLIPYGHYITTAPCDDHAGRHRDDHYDDHGDDPGDDRSGEHLAYKST
ncbi:MAG: hypothetical protein KBD24_02565 [Candidatus Pacebacteria bacterium]|nr:hypothetical protein [Candidatus Paceibacterota bacterium]